MSNGSRVRHAAFGLARRNARVLLGGAAVLLIGAGIAGAAIPGSEGAIDGCYAKDGQLRVIDTAEGESCRPAEQALSWNQVGPPGPPGISGFEQVTGADHELENGGPARLFAGAQALCPAGKQALGGGGFIGGPGTTTGEVRLYASLPHTANDGRSGWRAWAQMGQGTTDSWFIRAYVTCANVAG